MYALSSGSFDQVNFLPSPLSSHVGQPIHKPTQTTRKQTDLFVIQERERERERECTAKQADKGYKERGCGGGETTRAGDRKGRHMRSGVEKGRENGRE